MSNRKRWLCIAYAFPPINRSGTHRTLAFVKHLSCTGWDATVLTVNPLGESLDNELNTGVPRSTHVFNAPCFDFTSLFTPIVRWRKRRSLDTVNFGINALSEVRENSDSKTTATGVKRRPPNAKHRWVESWLKQLLQLPDSKIGWFLSAFPFGLRAVLRNRPEVIYSTSPYMTAHLIAMAINAVTRIPWVADFRDPWTENPFRKIDFASLRRIDARMESLVLQRASRIVCTTPTLLQSFASRGNHFNNKTACIPNGIDTDIWRSVEAMRVTSSNDFTFVHAGQFYGRRSPITLLEGMRRAIARQKPSSKPVRLVLVGSEKFDGKPLAEIAKDQGVGSAVIVLGPRDHRETMSLIAGADANILVGADGDGADLQVPNKLFEYLGARRPILALMDRQNPAVVILSRSKADAIVCDPSDSTALAERITAFATKDRIVAESAWSGIEEYSRERRALELESIFRELVSHEHSASAFTPRPAFLRS